MKQIFIKSLTVILVILLLSNVTAMKISASPDDLNSDEYEVLLDGIPITSQAAVIIDFATGLVVYEFNASEQRVPASMTKMAAAYVVFDAIRDGFAGFDTMLEITEEASRFSYVRAYSNVPMPMGSSYTVRELLDVVIVRSASAATISLGEGLFGSEEALVDKMNEKAEQLGIAALFHDSWGGSPDNRISASGMAELTRSFIKEHPEILEITSQKSVLFDEREYASTNPLLSTYDGVDGFKTGYTRPAGWCFTSTAEINGRRLITVTMGSVQGSRFPDTVVLLDYGFSYYNITIAGHFRNSIINSLDIFHTSGTPLVPISLYKNIYEAQYIDIRDLAVILNETERND
ncbi:MAG: D-alanyl-D-alanine carboxypeptidase [Oscillospiraceae bacterium]|nr:D-alanyl-D-alanine carboxypeptidase [Oscillospiraceae bacterium]